MGVPLRLIHGGGRDPEGLSSSARWTPHEAGTPAPTRSQRAQALHQAATEMLFLARGFLAQGDPYRSRQALACSRRYRREAERFTTHWRAA